ncbi:hypothetical protein [Butyricimonas synergistica]|uniref:hypothetical protein n=1 Tax=Butyricimonas synergistica TaxID=544644 RepID=UPI0022E4C219|nr:hypothetical protein [Butyricimonas synergistica]
MAKGLNLKALFTADTKDVKKGAKEAQEAISNFEGKASGVLDEFTSLFGTSMGRIGEEMKVFKGGLLLMQKGMAGSAEGAGMLSKALKFLKVALISTGIGAIVVALGSLVAYFTKTQTGADKLRQFLEPLKTVFQVIMDTVAALGGKIFDAFSNPKQAIKDLWEFIKSQFLNRLMGMVEMVKNVAKVMGAAIKLDWSGVKDNSKELLISFSQTVTGLNKQQQENALNSLTAYGSKLGITYDKAQALEKRRQNLEKNRIAFIKEEADLHNRLADLRLKTEDKEKYSAMQRYLFNQKAMAVLDVLGQKRNALAKEEYAIMVEQNALAENMNKDYEEENNLYKAMVETQTQILSQKKEMVAKNKELITQAKTLDYAIVKNLEKNQQQAKKDGKQKIIPLTYKIELAHVDTGELKDIVTDYAAFDKEIIDISESIKNSFQSIAVGFGESIGALIAGTGSLKSFTSMIAGVFADMAIQVGKIAIQLGLAMIAIESSLSFGNPFAPIAAGIALVALGTAVKASLSKVASGGGTSGSSSSYSDTLDVRSNRSEERSSREVNLNVSGEFKLQGNTLVAAINKENRRKNLTT